MSELRDAEGTHPVPCWFPHSPDCTNPTVTLTPERLSEITNLLRYESSIAFYSARAKESMLLLLAEAKERRAERAEIRSQTLIEAAESMEADCPDHGSVDQRDMVCRCESAGELRRMTAAFSTPTVPDMQRANGDPIGGA
ncbi:hypothetical protein ACFVSQ_13540 [Streptomyces niveus]|uniref:hypothetical protein n=1 Tax=Streptomyces niveus TaxID=193462 RepID=UPI0036E8EC11